jgi:hypothetical protein
MRNIVLDIIVIAALLEVAPSKRQVNISIINQGVLSGVILVLFWYCSGIVMVISLLFYHF